MKKVTGIMVILSLCLSLVSPVAALTKSEIPGLAKSNAKNLETRIKNSVSSSYSYSGYRGLVLDDWAKKEVSMADELNLMPDTVADYFHEPITRANFASLCVSAIKVLTNSSDNDLAGNISPGQYSELEIRICSELGILQGSSDGNFYPDITITRQEAAAMLSRVAELFGYTPVGNPMTFKDIKGLWGESYIKNVSAMTTPYLQNSSGNLRVMGSVGNSQFAPDDIYSRQQAVATVVRLVGAITANNTGTKTNSGAQPTSTFKLPEDKTGYTPYKYDWELTGYDAQDIDGKYFRNGKYVRSDGMAVIYLDHPSSPDSFTYYLCVVNSTGQEMGQYYDANYVTETKAEDHMLSNRFTATTKNGVNCIEVQVMVKDEYFEPSLNPEGTYYLVRAKNK